MKLNNRQSHAACRAILLSAIVLMHTFINAQNYVSTYAGDGVSGFVNGDTASARFKTPFGICRDKFDNLFIADQDNHCIRKINPSGIVTTYAGTGVPGYLDGSDSIAQFRSPIDVCSDTEGNIYVSDFENQYIRKISTDGMVSTVAGNGIAGYVDGESANAEFDYPRGIVIDASGNLYIGDSWNHRIRKIDAYGNVSTYAGGGNSMGVSSVGAYVDGNDTSARFYTPCGLSIDGAGNIYVADAYNHRVRKIDPSQVVTTIAGSGGTGTAAGGFADGIADSARFNTLTELFADQLGGIFVGDTYNQRVRMVSNGWVTTIAGNGVQGFVNGIDSLAEFSRPRGVVPDSTGSNLYVCDNLNHVIRKITFGIAVGIPEVSSENEFALFPNPSSGKVHVSPNAFIREIKVIDIWGRKVYESHFFSQSDAIDLSRLTSGIYLAIFRCRDESINKTKVVIQH